MIVRCGDDIERPNIEQRMSKKCGCGLRVAGAGQLKYSSYFCSMIPVIMETLLMSIQKDCVTVSKWKVG